MTRSGCGTCSSTKQKSAASNGRVGVGSPDAAGNAAVGNLGNGQYVSFLKLVVPDQVPRGGSQLDCAARAGRTLLRCLGADVDHPGPPLFIDMR